MRRTLFVAVSMAALAVLLVIQRSSTPTRLVSLTGAQAQVRAVVGQLDVKYVPAGLGLRSKEEAPIPSSFRAEPAPKLGANKYTPEGTGKVYSQVFGTDGPDSGTLFVLAAVNPTVTYDLAERKAQRPGTLDTAVAGHPAIIRTEGEGRYRVIHWTIGPHVLIEVATRGPIDEAQLRAVAEGVSFR